MLLLQVKMNGINPYQPSVWFEGRCNKTVRRRVNNLKREHIKKNENEDFVAARVMAVFTGAIVMLWGLTYLWRAYDVAGTFFAALKINNILIGVSGFGLLASVIWAVADIRCGRFNKEKVFNGVMIAVFFAVLLASALLTRYSYNVAKRVLYVTIPGCAILHLIYSSYQREFFFCCLNQFVVGCCIWVMARTYSADMALGATVAAVAVCVLSSALFLAAGRRGGQVSFGGFKCRVYDEKNISVKAFCLLYLLTALLAVAAYLLGVPYAYYMLYGVIALVVAAAIYYTVRLI